MVKRCIAPKAILRFKERIRELTRRTRGISIDADDRRASQIHDWMAGLRVIWKQWKCGKVRFKELRLRGIGADLAAQTAGSAHGCIQWTSRSTPSGGLDLSKPTYSRSDGSYVVTYNGFPYHVIQSDLLYAQIIEYNKQHPGAAQPEPTQQQTSEQSRLKATEGKVMSSPFSHNSNSRFPRGWQSSRMSNMEGNLQGNLWQSKPELFIDVIEVEFFPQRCNPIVDDLVNVNGLDLHLLASRRMPHEVVQVRSLGAPACYNTISFGDLVLDCHYKAGDILCSLNPRANRS